MARLEFSLLLFLKMATAAIATMNVPRAATFSCYELAANLADSPVILPGTDTYERVRTENWSQTAWSSPSCIVQVSSTPDLQTTVHLLARYDVQFAIRSGGHSPSPLAANIDDGVLLDLSQLRGLEYDAASQTAVIGTGLTWVEVYSLLEPHGVSVAGGRLPPVGVGGFLLGGGISYLSEQHGLGCDNVLNFEVVLASGEVVDANAEEHPDLFWALKGGGNNFGIVTRFTMRTYTQGPVWGGIRNYGLDQMPELLDAMAVHQTRPDKDPQAAVMMQMLVTNASLGIVLNMVYMQPEVPSGTFAAFDGIPIVVETTRVQSWVDFLAGHILPDIPRWDFATATSLPSTAMYRSILEIATSAPELDTIRNLTGGTFLLGLQPIARAVVDAGSAKGGNALGLQPVDQTFYVLDTAWVHVEDDASAYASARGVAERIEQAARRNGDYLGNLYMNYAGWDQDPVAGYGEESVGRLREVQRRYDPRGVFYRLAFGGFKIPR